MITYFLIRQNLLNIIIIKMGNFFKKIPTEKFDENLVTFLKTKKLQDINDANYFIN